MKSEHRHELKTNELAKWLVNFPQWAKENFKLLIYISVIGVAVVGSVVFRWYNRSVGGVQRDSQFTGRLAQIQNNKVEILRARSQGIDISYNLLGTAENFQSTVQKTKNDQIASLALIKQAQMLRTELHYRGTSVNKLEIESAVNQAKELYITAIEKAAENVNLAAMGHLGLGLCEEELGNFDQAKQIYESIAGNSDFEGTSAFEQAKRRLEVVDDYRQLVVFKESPRPRRTREESVVVPQISLPFYDVNQDNQ